LARVMYIMGSGRSGSTLLDRFAGANPEAVSCGELCNLVRAIRSPDEFCACGAKAADCLFWKSVMRRWKANVADHSIDEFERLRIRLERLRAALGPSPRDLQLARYQAYTLSLLGAISNESGAAVIVDSSKSPARALRLAEIPEVKLTTVHLVRDPRAVASSYQRSYSKAPEQGLQSEIPGRSVVLTSMDWLLTNLVASKVRHAPGVKSMQLRYEDFVSDPVSSLGRIGRMVGLELAQVLDESGNLLDARPETHMIAGNRMRMLSRVNLRGDLLSARALGFPKWMAVTLLLLPALVAFRYPLLQPLSAGRQGGRKR
jgi:hypothetical protein